MRRNGGSTGRRGKEDIGKRGMKRGGGEIFKPEQQAMINNVQEARG